MENTEKFRRRRRRRLATIAAAVAVLLAAAFFLCVLLLTTKTVNGWHGLCLGTELTLTGKPFVKMSDEPLRYFTRYCDAEALGKIDGVMLDQETPGHDGYLYRDGRMYYYSGGAFTSRYWIWTLKPVEKEPESMVLNFVRRYIEENRGMAETEEFVEITDRLADWNMDGDDLASLAALLEEHFGVELPETEVAGWDTVEDVVASVGDRL